MREAWCSLVFQISNFIMNLNYFQTLIWLPKKTLNFHEVLEYLEDLKAS